jgi:hypothetical protein
MKLEDQPAPAKRPGKSHEHKQKPQKPRHTVEDLIKKFNAR